MKVLSTIVLLSTLLFFSGCDDHQHDHHEADERFHDLHHEEEQELEPIAITDYTKETELFVEFEPFVVDRESTFLAHFTYMDSFKPFKEGFAEACLTFKSGDKECFSVDAPASEGIFKPVAIPKQSGLAHLEIKVIQGNITQTHKLGEFQVYASVDDVPLSDEEESEDGISYLKEQQWKVEFATEITSKRSLYESISTFAKVKIPSNQEHIVSAPVAGMISPLKEFSLGSKIEKNDELAYITPFLGQKEDISTLKFELKKAKANLNLEKEEYSRIKQLQAKNAVSQKRIIEGKKNYEMAKAKYNNILTRLNQVQRSGKNQTTGVVIKSPLNGTIAKKLVLAGAYVDEGESIVHIVNSKKLWIDVNIPQSELDKVSSPLGVELIQNKNSYVFSVDSDANFVYFSDVIDEKTRCASLVFEIDNPPSFLKSGATYTAKAYSGKKLEALAIPKSSIVNDNGQYVVYIQTGGESFERRVVETGISQGDYIEVVSGVNEGEHIVTKGAYQVLLSAVSPAEAGHGHAH